MESVMMRRWSWPTGNLPPGPAILRAGSSCRHDIAEVRQFLALAAWPGQAGFSAEVTAPPSCPGILRAEPLPRPAFRRRGNRRAWFDGFDWKFEEEMLNVTSVVPDAEVPAPRGPLRLNHIRRGSMMDENPAKAPVARKDVKHGDDRMPLRTGAPAASGNRVGGKVRSFLILPSWCYECVGNISGLHKILFLLT